MQTHSPNDFRIFSIAASVGLPFFEFRTAGLHLRPTHTAKSPALLPVLPGLSGRRQNVEFNVISGNRPRPTRCR